MLQTLASNESYRASEPAFGEDHGQTFGEDHGQSLNFRHYIDILRRRIFYFLVPFGLISVTGLYNAANQKPDYISEGKILIETQRIAPDLVRPIVTSTASERIQLIQQRILTRDNLLAIASKFGLFPQHPRILDLMRISTYIKPIDVDGQLRQSTPSIAFAVGFQYSDPQLAMRVANEFVTLIVNEDARSRTSRATEAVKILAGETKDIEDRLESVQMQMLEIARRPRDAVPEIPEQEKSRLTALAALKAELIQKTAVYSEAHPSVTALKKRIAAMEKTLMQSAHTPPKAQSTQTDDIEALKRQREVLEKRLDDANSKLGTARLSEKLDRDQQSERLEVIESPSLPQRPIKSEKLKTAGMAFAAAIILGIGAVFATERFDGSIRSRHQLSGVIDNHLIVSIPYMANHADIVRSKWRILFIALTVIIILVAVAAIVFHLPIDLSWLGKSWFGFRAAGF